ncbi:ion transporter [Modestobacter sp. VKM Ac-2979]|uniref:ArsA family ATPase n=1 Tax=unclassified Modestobacter TaxID=2643866 RepID=UPI0022AB5AFC|nr:MULTISPECIES: ArsA-related P-loop ATPase [unclassified Modestobacter]MCZ2813015.1 ion transporter [Modestobacter sp. VKM Ac-2979]MCZ2842956.1 ion transporter [Modestobacter sp. VKM Ac-2980]
MRAVQVLLVTGPGGAGSSTVAAATAARLAGAGSRCVLLTGQPAGITDLTDRVTVDVVAPQPALEELWDRHAGQLADALPLLTVPPASSVVPLPGVAEFALLTALVGHLRDGDTDVVVLDPGPTATATALLGLPGALRWWLAQAAPTRLRVLATLRAAATPGRAGVTAGLLAGAAATEELLDAVALADPARTAVHLVLRPDAAAAEHLRHAATALGVHGQRIASVTVSRLLPGGSGEWWQQRAAVQEQAVHSVRALLDPVREVAEAAVPPASVADLLALGAAVPETAVQPLTRAVPRRAGGEWLLDVPLPFTRRGEVELTRWADDLVVTAGGVRRSLALDALLRRCTVSGGALTDPGTARAVLEVRFVPDPDQWPAGLLAAGATAGAPAAGGGA